MARTAEDYDEAEPVGPADDEQAQLEEADEAMHDEEDATHA